MKKIDVMIIGAQKAGTTSLKLYLSKHPRIASHSQVEFGHFLPRTPNEEEFDKVFDNSFGPVDPSLITVAKNADICETEEAISALFAHNPKCKLIYVVRNPIDRAFSSYRMERFYGSWDVPFDDINKIIASNDFEHPMFRIFIGLGLYSNHLRFIYKYFPKESVRIFIFEKFVQKPAEVCGDIFRWLELEEYSNLGFDEQHNKTSAARSKFLTELIRKLLRESNPVKKIVRSVLPNTVYSRIGKSVIDLNRSNQPIAPMTDETRECLQNFFHPFNREFEEMSGIDVDIWT